MRRGFCSQDWIAFVNSCKAVYDHNSSSREVTGTCNTYQGEICSRDQLLDAVSDNQAK